MLQSGAKGLTNYKLTIKYNIYIVTILTDFPDLNPFIHVIWILFWLTKLEQELLTACIIYLSNFLCIDHHPPSLFQLVLGLAQATCTLV